MKRLAMLPCVLVLALAGPAAAQGNDPNAAAPASPCQAEPQGQNSGQQPPPAAGTDLSAKLDPCDGVLKPPPSGDQGMTQPPPDEGNTPVIKPGDVPAQPPKQ